MQLEDGDIVCLQKSIAAETGEHFRYPDVPSFLDYVHNRQVRPDTSAFLWPDIYSLIDSVMYLVLFSVNILI